LVEVVVVVPRHVRDEVANGHPAPAGVDAAPLPLLRRESPEVGQRLLAPLLEGGERLGGVVAEILPVFGPAVRGGGLPIRLHLALVTLVMVIAIAADVETGAGPLAC
jgi:hypothetical protein